jgi:RNA polymerase sigma-70 factor, ECF subfamily
MHDEFEQFVREHQNMVFSTAMRITSNQADAQDIAQQVFLQAFKQFSILKEHQNVGGWLRLSARNLSINHVKRYMKRWIFFDTISEISSEFEIREDNNSEDNWLFENVEMIKKALVELPDKFRVPLVLFYYEGLAYYEIAVELRCSEAKVKTDIFRAKKVLLEKMKKRGVGETV